MSAVLRRRRADANSMSFQGATYYHVLYVVRLLGRERERAALWACVAAVVALAVGTALGFQLGVQADHFMVTGR